MTTTVIRFTRAQTSWVNPLVIRFTYEPLPELPFDWGAIGLVTDAPYFGQLFETASSCAFGASSISIEHGFNWAIGSLLNIDHQLNWAQYGIRDGAVDTGWQVGPMFDTVANIGYADIAQHTTEITAVWSTDAAYELTSAFDWSTNANSLDLPTLVDVGLANALGDEFAVSFQSGTEQRQFDYSVTWGPHPSGWHCSTNYRPPKGKVTARFNHTYTPTGGTLTLRFTASALTCDYDDGGGYLDGNTDLPSFDFEVPIEPQIKRLYLMQPTLSVRRVSDNDEIAVTSVNISDSRGQFSTSVSMEFASKGDMLLAMNELLHIEINGYDFYAIPEQSSQRRSFNATQYSASGRCAAAAISAPWKLPINYSNAVDRSFAGICGDILAGTGWTVELVGFTDFTIPAKVFSTTGKAPAEAINEMADMIGCMVLSDDANNKLKILPKFPVSPWSMAGATAAVAVHESVIVSYSATDEINQLCNTCWVRGEQQGVSRQIRRTGTAGNIATSDISNALIVADTPARLAGTAAIAATGQKEKVSIELPVMNDLPPLVKGMLVGVSFYGDTYKATCDTTSITASVQNDGSIDVTQSVTLIRHME